MALFRSLEEKGELEGASRGRRGFNFFTWGSPAPAIALTLLAVGVALIVADKSGGYICLALAVLIYGLHRFGVERGDVTEDNFPFT